MLLAAVEVECTNCGGSDLPIVLAGVGVVIALIALGMNLHQYAVFRRERNARAELKVTVKAWKHAPGEPNVIEFGRRGDLVRRIEIGITNEGDKEARHVGINFAASAALEGMRWVTQDGGSTLDSKRKPMVSEDEKLTAPDGDHDVQYLAKQIDVLPTKGHYVTYVSAKYSPYPGDGETVYPFRVEVWSADAAEDHNELWNLTIRRRLPA